MDEERHLILEMIESGKITAEQGLNLIRALSGDEEELPAGQDAPPPEPAEMRSETDPSAGESRSGEDSSSDQAAFPAGVARWRGWWAIPLWVGVGLTVLAGSGMAWAWQSTGAGFWFYCAWLPFMLGVAMMALAWQSRTARWLHVRVHQKPGAHPKKIAFSFPVPVRLTAWFLRTFRRRIPGLENTSLDDVIVALDNETGPEQPFYVEVEDHEDGERVEVYFG